MLIVNHQHVFVLVILQVCLFTKKVDEKSVNFRYGKPEELRKQFACKQIGPTNKATRVTATDAVVNYISTQIKNGIYQLGDKLPNESACPHWGPGRFTSYHIVPDPPCRP